MRYLLVFFLATAVYSCRTASHTSDPGREGFSRYVNPFVGTTPLTDPRIVGFTVPKGWRPWSGLTYPGSSLPNAMVQLSPMTEYGSGAGYEYEDSVILGFTHTNKGHWNLCNIPLLPITGQPDSSGRFISRYDHSNESAAPGYYQVYLQDFAVNVRLTSTLRCGYHQYAFADGRNRRVLFDLARANNGVINWAIEQDGDSAVSGFQEIRGEKVYFYAALNAPLTRLEKKSEGKRNGNAIVHVTDGRGEPLEVKIALSYVSIANAKKNFDAEIRDKTFAQVRHEADVTWENLLSRIEVEGGNERRKEMFYSSLYRMFLWPALRSDVNGEYFDEKKQVVKADFRYYTVPSLWDTYRNKLVMLGLLSPDVTADVIQSLKDMGDKTGFIPTFFHGDHAAPFIAGSYLRGINGFDVQGAYKLLLRNAFVEGPSRPHLNEYMQKGFISDPQVDSAHVETKGRAGVSKTLEYAYDDYALAQMAQSLGDSANYHALMQRAGNYRNVFDYQTRFMRGRLENGDWIKHFNPQYPYYEYMYREANAWQVSFYAPHDMPGLIDLYGGPARFESKLDSLFTVPWNPSHIARNVETMIGQYCHGNQPDHEAPFSYHFIGKPEKSQKVLDYIIDSLYGIGPEGLALSGMDDAGEMSAWYVFSALGLYPFSSADPQYIVTVPVFDAVHWHLGGGRKLTIRNSGGGRNMQSIRVNGKDHYGYFVPHELFLNGGSIDVMTK